MQKGLGIWDQAKTGEYMKRLAILPAVIILLAILASCGSDPTATPLPTATPVPQINQVSFTAVDYGFNGPDSIPAGMTTITLVNEGQDIHHQQLLKLPPGMAAADLIAAVPSSGQTRLTCCGKSWACPMTNWLIAP